MDLLRDYKSTFSTDHGLRVLYDLMKNSFFMNSTYSNNVNDVMYREGMRNVVLMILQNIELDISEVRERIKQIKENEEEDFL